MPNHWIGVVSRSHIRIGVQGGFIQLNHGRKAPVRRLQADDRIVIYSPRTAYPDGRPLQAFTAMGTVVSGEVYQVQMTEDFAPFRVDVVFEACTEAPIQPLIGALDFIRDKQSWGAAFRFGHLKIPEADYRRIRAAMSPQPSPVTC